MRPLLKRLDDGLEKAVTFLYGPSPKGEERPSLWFMLVVFLVFTTVVGWALAANLLGR